MLNDIIRDIISIVGFAATIAGLMYAIAQIRKTTSAAKAAEEAAKKVLEESQRNFRKYATLFAHRYVNEVKLHIHNKNWAKAAMRAGDLADQMAQIVSKTVDELRYWAVTFDRLATGDLKTYSKRKCAEFLAQVESEIVALIGPFEQKS